MSETIFRLILQVAGAYCLAGLCFAVVFVSVRSERFDPSAATGSWGFRLAIIPGVVVLWPVLLAKVSSVRRGGGAEGDAERPVSPERLRRNHALAFFVLAVAVPLLFLVALVWRAPGWEDVPAAEVSGLARHGGAVKAGEGPVR